MDFLESLFVCLVVSGLFVCGVLICHAIGLGVMWLRDRWTGKKSGCT